MKSPNLVRLAGKLAGTMVAFGLLIVAPAQPAGAQQPVAPPDPGVPAALGEWLDPLIEQQLQAAHIPGAVFLLVADGEVAYARGYGLADLARQTPVDVEHSLWRVMSLSKPVTAVAVMQLAEQGKLDLHTDVNTYLQSYQLPAAFGAPVTTDQLLTHSAGLDFDLDDIGTAAATPADLVGNARFLNNHPPRRIFPPGRDYLYTNAAFNLAGQLVEDISGIPFADYVDRQIFQPLGMTRSTFLQPPSSAGLVSGYTFDGASHHPVPLPLWQDPPSRSLTATAPDMARFMQALLGDGSPILQTASLRTLLATHFTYRADTPGLAYGWHDMRWPGLDAVSKDGGGAGALSRILLFPDQKLGLFLAYNLDDGFGLANAVTKEFLSHNFPFTSVLPAPAPGANERSQALTGVYRLTTYARQTISKLLRLDWPDYPQVTAQTAGRLLVTFAPETDTVHELTEVAPRQYRKSDGESDYVFYPDAPDQPAGFAVGDWVTERVAWYDTGQVHLVLFLGGAVASWVIARRLPADSLARRGLWLLTATAALNFAFLVIFFLVFQLVVSGNAGINFDVGMPAWLAALFFLPLLTSALTLILPVVGWLGWQRRALTGRGLALYGLFTLLCLLFIPWLNYWNLLGFRW
jgi:CubicO group peptidase (beta-lactamase class C family)